jgi:hypothetical protein
MIKERVYVFIGDMASEMGCFNEAVKFAIGKQLPITFIIEDNEIGCNTPTFEVWGLRTHHDEYKKFGSVEIIHYHYKRYYPHYGIGEFVTFKKGNIKSKGDYQAYKN